MGDPVLLGRGLGGEWVRLSVILVVILYLYLKHLRQVRSIPLRFKAALAMMVFLAVLNNIGYFTSSLNPPTLELISAPHYALILAGLELSAFGLLMWAATVELVQHFRAEQDLAKEQLLRNALLSGLDMGVVVVDPAKNVMYSNASPAPIPAIADESTAPAVETPTEPLPLPDLAWPDGAPTTTYTVGTKTFEVRKKRVPAPGNGSDITVYSWWDVSHWNTSRQLAHEFVAAVSHELRTPLTSIRGYLELVLNDDNLDNDHRRYLTTAMTNVDRLAVIVGDLLDLSRIDAGILEFDLEEHDVTVIVRQHFENMMPEFRSKEIIAKLDVPYESLIVIADRDRLYQILSNLIGNACKYNQVGGQVSVRVTATAENVTIAVSDTGIGIPEEEQPHVFERFFRSSRSRQLAVRGTGLGLAITKSLVELMGGPIGFTSEEGKGSMFYVTLPRGGFEARAGAEVEAREEGLASPAG